MKIQDLFSVNVIENLKTNPKPNPDFVVIRLSSSPTDAFSNLVQNRFCFDAAVKPLLARLHHVQVSKPAPDFKGTAVVNGAFKEIQLADYKGKYVYLFFYPLDL